MQNEHGIILAGKLDGMFINHQMLMTEDQIRNQMHAVLIVQWYPFHWSSTEIQLWTNNQLFTEETRYCFGFRPGHDKNTRIIVIFRQML